VSNNEDDASSGSADVVDFDALNAALGALPPPPTSSSPMVGESQGRPSATYSSARPHTIPPAHTPSDDPNAPAVIVQVDDTVQTGPPVQMTLPMGQAPISSGHHPIAAAKPPPSSGSHALPPRPPTSENVQLTIPMVNRPVRPRTPTIVVRTRGPTKSQKFLVFISMLVVFVGGGIAFLIMYKPPGLHLESLLPGTPKGSATAPTLGAPGSPLTGSVLPNATPSGTAKGPVGKPKPR
jgi:hypothetical protein